MHPFVPAVSSKSLLPLRWSQNLTGPFEPLFGSVIVGGIRVVLGPHHSNFNSVVTQTADADDYEHTSSRGLKRAYVAGDGCKNYQSRCKPEKKDCIIGVATLVVSRWFALEV